MQEGDSENPACQSSRQPFAQISTLLQAGLANLALHDQRLSYRAPSVARCNPLDSTRRTAAVIARTDQHRVGHPHSLALGRVIRAVKKILQQADRKSTRQNFSQ